MSNASLPPGEVDTSGYEDPTRELEPPEASVNFFTERTSARF